MNNEYKTTLSEKTNNQLIYLMKVRTEDRYLKVKSRGTR